VRLTVFHADFAGGRWRRHLHELPAQSELVCAVAIGQDHGLQPDGLRNAQACRVAGGQDHPMSVAIHAAEEMHNFFRAQDDG
jgi:hypothetical protein